MTTADDLIADGRPAPALMVLIEEIDEFVALVYVKQSLRVATRHGVLSIAASQSIA